MTTVIRSGSPYLPLIRFPCDSSADGIAICGNYLCAYTVLHPWCAEDQAGFMDKGMASKEKPRSTEDNKRPKAQPDPVENRPIPSPNPSSAFGLGVRKLKARRSRDGAKR
jgi:hypothetical protein